MSNSRENYNKYVVMAQKAADLNNASAVLGWDQEVYMPPKSADIRGRQLATLATMAHEIVTSREYGELLASLSSATGFSDEEAANVQLSKDDFDKNSKLPSDFIDQLSRLTSECFNAWIEAREKNDYAIFAPHLAKMIAMKKQQADLLGYAHHPYDALLDEYEKGLTVETLDKVFSGLKATLPKILDKILASNQVSNACFLQHFSKDEQWAFGMEVLEAMGYDMEAGRQDYAVHPFTTSFSATDVRITTRVDENNFASMLWSTIHEGGHALYEQGLPVEQYGLPLGAATSLGIHESQSRLWENCLGRGREFWDFFYPKLQARFPHQLEAVTVDGFFKAMNRVSPSLVRTEADEITYHYHVLIRYEIEKGLFEGTVAVDDLATVWDNMYEKYLGIRPATHKEGILQDVHWSHGSFGYFPTYSLGSFYAAQFMAQARIDLAGLDIDLQMGDFKRLLNWLSENIHCHGRRYTSEQLCKRITGKELDIEIFMDYINKKFSMVYA